MHIATETDERFIHVASRVIKVSKYHDSLPKDNGYKRHDHRAGDEKCEEDEYNEDIDGGALLRTQTRRSTTVFNALTADERLYNSTTAFRHSALMS